MQRLEKKEKLDMDDDLQDNADVYAESFENESSALLLPSGRSSEASSSLAEVVTKARWAFWNRARKVFLRAGQVRKDLKHLALHGIEHLSDKGKVNDGSFLIDPCSSMACLLLGQITDRSKSGHNRNGSIARIDSLANI